MNRLKVGVAMCGSYCTFARAMDAIRRLCGVYEVTPIMSERSVSTDTRFGNAEEYAKLLRDMTGKEIISTVRDAEPIGPKKLLDALIILPCTGNTIAKLAAGVTDSSVTMAAKAHLRNGGPLIVAVSTNDALSANAKNIGILLDRKNVYLETCR